MNSEERFQKIENALQHAAELQAQQAEQLHQHDQRWTRIEADIDKQNAGIRDLILISRTVLTAIEEQRADQAATDNRLNRLAAAIEEQRAAQAATDNRLNRLADMIEKWIRGQRPNGQG